MFLRMITIGLLLFGCSTKTPAAEVPLGGFIPFVGISLTDEFDTFDTDTLYNVADPRLNYTGGALDPNYFDIALLDTGASTHILTQAAAGSSGFNISGAGLSGTNFQPIFGATGGAINLRINDPMGIYTAGLGDRTSAGASLGMDTNDFVGQTSVAILEGGSDWTLPNILGLPMAAQHGILIRNDQPQIFDYQGRTMRTPQVEFFNLGDGSAQGMTRRTDLKLEPSASFISGPLYVPNLEIDLNLDFHDDPLSPTVVDSGGLYLEVDMEHDSFGESNVDLLFDTGADLTVISEVMAASLGFDVVLDEPDFVLEVEGAGGVSGGVPGFYLDELKIDAVGGSMVLNNVPVAVLNVPNPGSPANVIDGIIGMHLFAGRNLAIDAAPAAVSPGSFPSLYISDPVTEEHQWATTAASADWATSGHWSAPGVPGNLWVAQAVNVSGSNQVATVSADSTVFELQVSGGLGAKMTVEVQDGATLTTFGQALIETGGELRLDGGKLDSQVVNIEGGTLSGNGEVFAGTGPISGVVRNLSGMIAPEGLLTVTGDLSNLEGASIVMDLFDGGNDQVDVSRFAFLGGTLEVNLAGGFEPSVGAQFTLFTYGEGVSLDFSVLDLPLGYTWNLFDDAGTDSVILEVTALEAIPGDFDENGFVDYQDLAMWEAGFLSGGYSMSDFLTWQRNLGFGTPPTGIGVVPEPSTGVLAISVMLFWRRRR